MGCQEREGGTVEGIRVGEGSAEGWRRETLGRDLPPARRPAAPCLRRGSESHRGFPGMPDCFLFDGFTLSLTESSLLPFPLACEARLSVTYFAEGDHHLLPSSTASPFSPSLLHSQQGMGYGGTWCSPTAGYAKSCGNWVRERSKDFLACLKLGIIQSPNLQDHQQAQRGFSPLPLSPSHVSASCNA